MRNLVSKKTKLDAISRVSFLSQILATGLARDLSLPVQVAMRIIGLVRDSMGMNNVKNPPVFPSHLGYGWITTR